MRLVFTKNAWEDFEYWIENDQELLNKLRSLLNEVRRTPFKGTGKPEPLRGSLKGCWARSINQEHRLVYRITGKADDQSCIILQCRFHY
ncbi:Txe/YoeB family addiction module toxin [Croceimicrobium hydrocarbonivorans]|uniref:Putative mRNA interferase YoeB n=1 Tax=Croceimicrobium hydrocarbonivorans TaxID=2761580 RepID=A0A7H0VAB9_9FLAO|nr:Txe/YoeB family addiction module toxin [Croceimicrobium hydrocarbonivorans]QNR22667.1 Txe/YoeB family addiction module toxin [Croceimicrobium hydrocarbonivorans]